MNGLFSIPPRTRAELSSPAPPGQRHEQAVKIAYSLIGQGLARDAVFGQLRAMYASDVGDPEIRDIVTWAVSKNSQPCGYTAWKHGGLTPHTSRRLGTSQRVTAEQAIANAEDWLGDFRCDECDLWHASPWRPLEDWRINALMLFGALYDKHASCYYGVVGMIPHGQ